MGNINVILSIEPPRSLEEARDNWPLRSYNQSPQDWRDEIFYFLLPDRFSNGKEQNDRLLDCDLSTDEGLNRIRSLRRPNWNWKTWQDSGANYYQGGTLHGIKSKLGYLADLGVTTLWIAPIFRQRVEGNTYHGYGIQNFLDIDPRFGTRRDLIELVDAAHSIRPRRINIILDIIFNHSGCNWLYDMSAVDAFKPKYQPKPEDSYRPIWPRNGYGTAIRDTHQVLGPDDYVWPRDLQEETCYLRAGCGNIGAGDLNDDNAEHKRTDFEDLRKFNLFSEETFNALISVYHYWIALADIDGFRIDTFKHVTQDQARNFCNAIKEYSETLGKENFFLVAEVAGGSSAEDRYLDITGRNLNACLDIGEHMDVIRNVAKGLQSSSAFFAGFDYYDDGMGSHRNYGSRHLSLSDDHDHVIRPKERFAVKASNNHQGSAAIAMQFFSLGIPCIYYGTEQGLAGGAEPSEQKWIDNWGKVDCILRETMFGPEHPRAAGWDGTRGKIVADTVGFGPHGTAGWHVFNPNHPIYTRIAQLAKVRSDFMPLRRGRQYPREISVSNDYSFFIQGEGELIAWSRIFDKQEILVVINPHGNEGRGGRVVVDKRLSSEGMQVIANTDPKAPAEMKPGAWLKLATSGVWSFVELFSDGWLLGPSEVMVLANHAAFKGVVSPWRWNG
jgi:glycosidase